MRRNFFAEALAHADSETQAEFLNDFFALLHVSCKGSDYTQLCYVADDLKTQTIESLDELSKYGKLALDSRKVLESDLRKLRDEKYKIEEEIERLKEHPHGND